MPKTTKNASPKVARNPMSDISNLLHNAVDNILSSVAAGCGYVPTSSKKSVDGRASMLSHGNQSVKTARNVHRTAAEVLGSLQRPQGVQSKNEVIRSSLPNPEASSHMHGKKNNTSSSRSTHVGVMELDTALEKKVSGNYSPGGGEDSFRNAIGEVNEPSKIQYSAHNKVCIAKEEALLLSSDASSEGAEFSRSRRTIEKKAKDVAKNTKRADTEEIGGWPPLSTGSASAVRHNVREIGMLNKKLQEEHQPVAMPMEQGKPKKSLLENPVVFSHKADVEVNSDDETRSYEETEQDDEEFQSLSDDEEAPVLPREIVKRKLDDQYGGVTGKKDVKGKSQKSLKTPGKKQRLTQIDASILKKLEFYKRPKNSVSVFFLIKKKETAFLLFSPRSTGKCSDGNCVMEVMLIELYLYILI